MFSSNVVSVIQYISGGGVSDHVMVAGTQNFSGIIYTGYNRLTRNGLNNFGNLTPEQSSIFGKVLGLHHSAWSPMNINTVTLHVTDGIYDYIDMIVDGTLTIRLLYSGTTLSGEPQYSVKANRPFTNGRTHDIRLIPGML